ncbi:MAG: acyl carrier protein [Coriobacteriales bacterium]|jgi:acyl carrier protein
MREKIIEILESVKPGVTTSAADHLVDEGAMDSLDLVTLISELEDEFDVEIDADDIIPENFDSVDTIVALMERIS